MTRRIIYSDSMMLLLIVDDVAVAMKYRESSISLFVHYDYQDKRLFVCLHGIDTPIPNPSSHQCWVLNNIPPKYIRRGTIPRGSAMEPCFLANITGNDYATYACNMQNDGSIYTYFKILTRYKHHYFCFHQDIIKTFALYNHEVSSDKTEYIKIIIET